LGQGERKADYQDTTQLQSLQAPAGLPKSGHYISKVDMADLFDAADSLLCGV
jgi:hypothetical protein